MLQKLKLQASVLLKYYLLNKIRHQQPKNLDIYMYVYAFYSNVTLGSHYI